MLFILLRQRGREVFDGWETCHNPLMHHAPWVIKAEDVAVFGKATLASGSLTSNPAQPSFDFQ
jgi:hypothetical protein